MRSRHSSLARLNDPDGAARFRDLFVAHGALGYGQGEAALRFGEQERLEAVPYVFGLLPRRAIVRDRPELRVKPLIREHLQALGLDAEELLVSVLKRVADQYFRTVVARLAGVDAVRPRRFGIEDLRAGEPALYRHILGRQRGRCCVCGARFGADYRETLDHVIPWVLLGDVPDGSNWRILCEQCNGGKREWLSSLQSPQALNWFYADARNLPLSGPTRETRYLVLATRRACFFIGCGATAADEHLFVESDHESGLAVGDNLRIACVRHARSMSEWITETPVTIEHARTALGLPTLGVPSEEGEHERPPSGPPGEVVSIPAAEVSQPKRQPTVPRSPMAAESSLGAIRSYQLTKRLTSGGMGEAFIAVDIETGERVFLKRVLDASADRKALQREAAIYDRLMRLQAQHVLEVLDFFSEDGSTCLVMECADGGDLHEYVEAHRPLSTDAAKRILDDIIEGVLEIHQAGIVHRDLKPRNVLLHRGTWCIADFGIGKNVRADYGHTTFRGAGTSGYAAPEQIHTGHEAQPAADIYALGKIATYLLTAETDVDRVRFKSWRRLIRSCTEEDPAARILLKDLRDQLGRIEE